jgi:4-hydroxythreonine-4-phosphate dehydrogenase
LNQSAPAAPIAISLGDPAGIGPELICEAWASRERQGFGPFFAVYGAQVLRQAAEMRGITCPIVEINAPTETVGTFADGLPVLKGEDGHFTPGAPDTAGASLAYSSLRSATELARTGVASAIVTAPISKAHLANVGFAHPGQTEFLSKACGIDPYEVVMMLAGPSLKAVPITVHCALAEVPARLSVDLICRKARVTAAALARDFGIAQPQLAIAGLNPHAGEHGKFGDEESRIIEPATKALQNEGIDASGPHPPDAMFTARARTKYDVALCMYHDQALIPLKALDFDEGVNVTLGLPIVRTSPDHGTAFDIAGKNIADPGAMIAAISMAGECAKRRSNG